MLKIRSGIAFKVNNNRIKHADQLVKMSMSDTGFLVRFYSYVFRNNNKPLVFLSTVAS